MRIYFEKYPTAHRALSIEGFREGNLVTLRIVETVDNHRKIIPQFKLSADIDPINDSDIYSVDHFSEMVEKAKQEIRNVDIPFSDTEADVFSSPEPFHIEDQQGADGNMYRLKLFNLNGKIIAATNLLSSLDGREDEINIHTSYYKADDDLLGILEQERLLIGRLYFSRI
ncbi:MAG: hypothetical protein IPG86_03990 [Chitinophagaceae bacterium]|nr:hypothetical protein [Chitinophagaceae bacterium]